VFLLYQVCNYRGLEGESDGLEYKGDRYLSIVY